MSLINDALKRAKRAQESPMTDAPAETSLPPLLSQPHAEESGNSIFSPLTLACLAICLLVVGFWGFNKLRHQDEPVTVAARTMPTEPPASKEAKPEPAQPVAAPAPAVSAEPRPTAQANPVPAPAPAVAAEPAPVRSEPVVMKVQSQPAKPLKLQAIVYNPARPSAMISGSTVFVGDRVGDLRVVEISRGSVTLEREGTKSVLTLGQ